MLFSFFFFGFFNEAQSEKWNSTKDDSTLAKLKVAKLVFEMIKQKLISMLDRVKSIQE